MNIKKLLLIFTLTLSACGSLDNKIGWQVSFSEPVESVCISRALSNFNSILELRTEGASLFFEMDEYQIEFVGDVADNLVSGYTIIIDGTWNGEETGNFYRNAEAIQK